MEKSMPKLKDVVLPNRRQVLLSELRGEDFASADIFRAHEVDCDLDAVRKVAHLALKPQSRIIVSHRRSSFGKKRCKKAHLMGASCRDEDCFSRFLVDSPTLHTLLFEKFSSQVRVQVIVLRVNGVGFGETKLLVQELSDLFGVPGTVDVPDSTPRTPILTRSGVQHHIYRISHIHVKPR